MTLGRAPLATDSLSEAVRKVLAAQGPVRTMAARGLAPLPRAADTLAVLYMLAIDADEALASAAQKTAGELPERVMGPGLADPTLDPLVLDFFAPKVVAHPPLVEIVLLNPRTADETVKDLCTKLDERLLDMVAQNEQRLLRAPAIIAALYLNPKARMSTVDRAVELAVRQKIVVPGIPAWDDVVAAVLGAAKQELPPTEAAQAAAAADAAFEGVVSFAIGDANVDDAVLEQLLADGETDATGAPQSLGADADKKKLQISKLSVPAKIRLATLGNSFARATLIRDTSRQVALAAAKSPGLTENEVIKYAGNRGLSDEVIRVLGHNKSWTRIYAVKLALVYNPKCPLAFTMAFLPFLRDKDVAAVAKSKAVPNALVQAAIRMVKKKTGG
jgi:hypothetical protein